MRHYVREAHDNWHITIRQSIANRSPPTPKDIAFLQYGHHRHQVRGIFAERNKGDPRCRPHAVLRVFLHVPWWGHVMR
jgi:hypothetical protein